MSYEHEFVVKYIGDAVFKAMDELGMQLTWKQELNTAEPDIEIIS